MTELLTLFEPALTVPFIGLPLPIIALLPPTEMPILLFGPLLLLTTVLLPPLNLYLSDLVSKVRTLK